MSKFEPFALGGVVALIACLHGSVALAADDAEREARERYENAVKLYEEGAYDAALVELNRTAELKPSYKIYYNIGQVRFAMHDYAAAIDAYRQYLDKGGDKIPVARREQVQKELTTLNQRVAKLVIETDVPGAEVFVDDVSIGSTPFAAPVVVNSGIRRVAARHPDYLPQSRRLSIAGGTQDTIKFAFVNRAAGAEPAPATPVASSAPVSSSAAARPVAPQPASLAPREAKPSRSNEAHAGSHHTPWLGWALTGAFAAGAAVTGVLTISANSSLSDDRGNLDVSSSDIDSKSSKVRTLATVTDGLIAAAVISGGVSLWLTLRDSDEQAPPVKVGFGPTGISLKAAF